MAYIPYTEVSWQQDKQINREEREEKLKAIVKLAAMILPSMLGLVVVVLGFKKLKPREAVISSKNSFGVVEYTTPYKNILYENFGVVKEPKLTLPMKTNNGYKTITFLLDSGAVVSALPMQVVEEAGVDLSKAKRITLQGFSGMPTFAYLDKVIVKIGGVDFSFPAVYTESQKTTYILGRKGFFDKFNINFDNKTKTVTIRGKK